MKPNKEEKTYYNTATDLSKYFTINYSNYYTLTENSTKSTKRSVNIKKEINMYNSKINEQKTIKKNKEKTLSYKEITKLETINLSRNINTSDNFLKKVLDKKKIFKTKYLATSINRSSKKLLSKNLEENSHYSTNPQRIQEYKLPPSYQSSSMLPNTATTLYKVLKKSQKEYESSMVKKIENFPNASSKDKDRTVFKKFALKNKIRLNFPDRKFLDDIPILYPIAKISGNDFDSNSEKNRFEKTLQSLTNLRFLIENDPKNERKHIVKFLITNGVVVKEEVESHKIMNFIRFLKKIERVIDKSKSVKEICQTALNNDDYDESDEYVNLAHPDSKLQSMESWKFDKMIKERRPRKISREEMNMKNYLATKQPILEKKMKIDKNNDEQIFQELENEFNMLSSEKGNHDLVKNFKICRFAQKNDIFLKKSPYLYNHNLEKIRKKNKLLEFIVWKRAKNNYLLKEETLKISKKEDIIL